MSVPRAKAAGRIIKPLPGSPESTRRMGRLSDVTVNRLPEDSLLRLTPVRHAVEDPYFSCVARPIDCNWNYAGLTESVAGYNPIGNIHYFATTSVLNRWLRDPVRGGRRLNQDDRLAKAVLVMTHDYLHSWAYRTLESIEPSIGVGRVPIKRENIEDFTYVHLLTEAAACVGLDYWYLCLQGIDERCNLGSLLGPVTTHYRERYAGEFRRFKPGFNVQRPGFFMEIVRLYCSDEIEGFSARDLKMSPKLNLWLSSELMAGRSQRYNTRLWLSHLGGFRLTEAELYRPLSPPSPERTRLGQVLGRMLWRKTQHGATLFAPPQPRDNSWKYGRRRKPDFRVYNLQSLPRAAGYRWQPSLRPQESFWFYVQQYVSQFRFPLELRGSTQRLATELARIRDAADQEGLVKLCSGLERMELGRDDPGPLEMIFLN